MSGPPNFHTLGPFRAWRVEDGHTTSWRADVNLWRIGCMVTVHRHAFHYSDRWVLQTSAHYDRKGLPQ